MPPDHVALSADAPHAPVKQAQPASLTDQELFRWRLFVTAWLGLPIVFTVVALARLFTRGPVMSDFIALLVAHLVASPGISAGYHRLFAHRSYTPKRWMRLTLAVLGSVSSMGPVFAWAAMHRRHHAYADTERDPHSPNYGFRKQNTLLERLRGLAHAHGFWLYGADYSPPEVWAPDLLEDRGLVWVNAHFAPIVLIGLVLPAFVTVAFTGTWSSFYGALLWGGFVRVAWGMHMTFLVASVTHVLGQRPFKTRDESGNVWPIALITWGESWHNNHHAFPSAAVVQFRWWQLDPTGWFIRALERCGVATNVKRASAKMIARKLAAE